MQQPLKLILLVFLKREFEKRADRKAHRDRDQQIAFHPRFWRGWNETGRRSGRKSSPHFHRARVIRKPFGAVETHDIRFALRLTRLEDRSHGPRQAAMAASKNEAEGIIDHGDTSFG